MRKFLTFLKALTGTLIFFISIALVISIDLEHKRITEKEIQENLDIELSQTVFEYGEGDANIQLIDLVLNADDFIEIECFPRVLGNTNLGEHKVTYKVKYQINKVINEKSIEKVISILDTIGPTIKIREDVTHVNKDSLKTLVMDVHDASNGIIEYKQSFNETDVSFWSYIIEDGQHIRVIAVDRQGNRSSVLVEVPESMRHLLTTNSEPAQTNDQPTQPQNQVESCYLSTTTVSFDGNTYTSREAAIEAGTAYVQKYQTQTNPPTGVAVTSVYKICNGQENQLEYYIWDFSWN